MHCFITPSYILINTKWFKYINIWDYAYLLKSRLLGLILIRSDVARSSGVEVKILLKRFLISSESPLKLLFTTREDDAKMSCSNKSSWSVQEVGVETGRGGPTGELHGVDIFQELMYGYCVHNIWWYHFYTNKSSPGQVWHPFNCVIRSL